MKHDSATIVERLESLLIEFRDYGDVAPAEVFRLEGFIESQIVTGLCSQDEVHRLIAEAYERVLARPFEPNIANCSDRPSLIRLSMYHKKAPVWPGGKLSD